MLVELMSIADNAVGCRVIISSWISEGRHVTYALRDGSGTESLMGRLILAPSVQETGVTIGREVSSCEKVSGQ